MPKEHSESAENRNVLFFIVSFRNWMNNFVANMIYPRWSAMIGDLREATKMRCNDRIDYLTAKREAYTEKMMKRWDKLAKLLIVKNTTPICTCIY